MMKKVYEIVFSPTGGMQKVADVLTRAWGGETVGIDLTDREADFRSMALDGEDLAVIAVPSYGGRVPVPAAERLSRIRGNGGRAVIVCVYGNRAYEDTLVELQDTVQQAGFVVVAAVAAIAEHSIAHAYGANRPDEEDCRQLQAFARRIAEKLAGGDVTTPAIPGNRLYKKAGRAGLVPKATGACNRCGRCAAECPVGAIDRDNPARVDKQACISCMRCVSVCPHHARKVNGVLLALVNRMLKKACSVRKACELYV